LCSDNITLYDEEISCRQNYIMPVTIFAHSANNCPPNYDCICFKYEGGDWLDFDTRRDNDRVIFVAPPDKGLSYE